MTIASLLLQPQLLERMKARSPAAEFADEVLALAHAIALDPVALEAVGPAFQQAGAALGKRLLPRLQQGLPQLLAGLRALIEPALQRLTALGDGAAPDSAGALLGRIADALDALAGATDSLSDDSIRAFVHRLATLFSTALGLDQALLRNELRSFLADLRTALLAGVAALAPKPAATRIALACMLQRLEAEFLPLLPVVKLNADLLADLVIAELRRSGVADLRDKGECLLGKIRAVLRALAEIARLQASLGVSIAAPRSEARAAPARRRGAAAHGARAVPSAGPQRSEDGSYLWYASWLYATRRQGFGEGNGFFSEKTNQWGAAIAQTIVPGYPQDEVWLSADRTRLILRRAGGDDEVLHTFAAPSEWHLAPQFATPSIPSKEFFSFPRIKQPFLETWAHVTAVLVESAAGLWHLIGMAISPKHLDASLFMWLWNWGSACSSGIAKKPLPSLINQKLGWGNGGKYLWQTVPVMSFVAGGAAMSGIHTNTASFKNSFLQYLTLLGGDAINSFKISLITNFLRELSLSVFTLINYTGPDVPPPLGDDDRPKNWDMAGPVIGFVGTLIGMVFFKLVRREDHGLPTSGDAGPFVTLWLLGGSLVPAFGALLGTLASWCVSRTTTPSQLGLEVGKAALIGLLTFPIQMYTSMEGDTDEGRYNPRVDKDGKDYSPPRSDFAGYPDAASSPYKLPYPQGEAKFVGQAHQGFFSHMRYNGTPQIYAVDFAHDFKDEVLAVRAGTVVDYFDWMPDNEDLDSNDPDDAAAIAAAVAASAASGLRVSGQTTGSGGGWNFVMVRHDTRDAAHDRDQGGAAAVTFAVYGHGATNGVRDAFATRGIAGNAIIGSVVQQGQLVMLAGDTGVSFHNHLHLHIRGAPVPAAGAPAPNGPSTPYTLPFVFRDVTHVLGRDGVPQYLTWYRSDNPKVG